MKLSRSPSTPAAEEDRVLVLRLAHQADVAVVRPGAAVGAAGHPRGEHFVLQAELVELGFELVDHARQHALALGDRQAAGGQGGAGHRPAADGGEILA